MNSDNNRFKLLLVLETLVLETFLVSCVQETQHSCLIILDEISSALEGTVGCAVERSRSWEQNPAMKRML